MEELSKAHHIQWDERHGVAANARRRLPVLVAEYFAVVRELLAKDPAPPELHQLRLATKRLRYTLELFRACYGPGLETRLKGLRQLQQMLGEVNDSAATARFLQGEIQAPAQRTRVESFLEERARQKAGEFRKHWKEVFDAPGRERWWSGYLRREARTPGRRA